ncbi:putative methyltransferase NSUN7 [Antennarius striatus]|uniref:putative methyltransferase NSUN7 n=1 Tax=Antennarius striatus TaxID=241820 RepID=UPI0035B228EF
MNTKSESEAIVSPEDQSQQTSDQSHSFLPAIPHVSSSVPSPAPSPSDRVYLQAAAIFQQLQRETMTGQLLPYRKKTDTPLPESRDKPTQRQAYQLVFNTLKYQTLLEDMIADSRFHTRQQISSDLLPLAMVMLFDYQDRRFLPRKHSSQEEEETLQEVRDLERKMLRCETRLAASLARCRVMLNLKSVSRFLSEPIRTKQHRAKNLPLYAWVNPLKASVEEMIQALRSAGLCDVKEMSDLREVAFCRDPLCPDTLVFTPQLHRLLQHSSFTTPRVLNVQDRSLCVAVSVLRPLLFENGDVLVAGSFSAVTVAHVAVVAAARSGRVLVCGADRTPSQTEEIQEVLAHMEIKNVRVLSETFCGLHESDAAVQRLKVILVLPQCSCSALSDPVPTMYEERGDWDLLPDLSQGSVSQRKIEAVSSQQGRLLAHALSFPKVQTVVYCTRSLYPEENEQLVKRALEKMHTHPKLLPFRVNGPIFPEDSQSEDTPDSTDSKFFRLEPSQFTNGCFVARLSRQADPTKVETVQDVLARAAAKGLLGGLFPEQTKTGKKGKSRKDRVASAGSNNSSTSDQEKDEDGEGPVSPSGCEEKRSGEKDEGEKEAKKRKGLKRKVKRQSKQTNRTKHRSKDKKEPKKRRLTQFSHNRHTTKSKPRRIPRLTLTLMSSMKPSSHLSPIAALAHKISDSPTVKSQQTVTGINSPARLPPPTPHAGAEKQKGATKPQSLLKTKGKTTQLKTEVVKKDTSKPAGVVLPPIPSQRTSTSSPLRLHSQAPDIQLVQTSASSSSSLSQPGL